MRCPRGPLVECAFALIARRLTESVSLRTLLRSLAQAIRVPRGHRDFLTEITRMYRCDVCCAAAHELPGVYEIKQLADVYRTTHVSWHCELQIHLHGLSRSLQSRMEKKIWLN